MDNKRFGIEKAYGHKTPGRKSKNGNLVLLTDAGEKIIESDKPYALLQFLRNGFIEAGYPASKLKIHSLKKLS